MSRRVQTGGASTINGVLYQMLWSLLRTTELRVRQCIQDTSSGEITQAVLRLEPIGGGGDLQEISASNIVVEQVKARSTGKPWSLREVIDHVLPDLYRAIDDFLPGLDGAADQNRPTVQYRFVTEGRKGGWEKEYDFFRSLKTRPQPTSDILSMLDNNDDLTFNEGHPQTERSIFEEIVGILRKHKPAQTEPLEKTHRKLWHLLSNFEMEELRSMEDLQIAIDDTILAMGCPNNDLETRRDAMLTKLAKLAKSEDSDIDVQQFLGNYGLSIPITNWLLLKNDCTNFLHRYLKNSGYDALYDVRRERLQGIASVWKDQTPIVIFSGESGQGKTWALYGAADLLTEQRLVIVIEAKDDADKDIEKAARAFCEDVWKVDITRSLNRIASLLASEERVLSSQWLTVCIDGVQNADEARHLAQMDWEGWGVRLLVSCSNVIAQIFQNSAQSRVKRIAVSDFTLKELYTYLSKTIGVGWPDIPPDMLDTLRRPLLAGLYHRTFAADTDWRPTNEYELYERYWRRIREQDADTHPLDEVKLRGLARRLLNGTPYPWTGELLQQADIDDSVVIKLVKAGWLRTTSDGCYEIVHTRLLNWAVAEGLVAAYRAHEIDADELCDTIQKLFDTETIYSNQNLGYVPMDAFWLLTKLTPDTDELIDRLILTLESNGWQSQRTLYQNLPTLGKQIVPALARRVESLPTDETTLAIELYDALAQFDGETVAPEALRLLEHPSPYVRRSGCRILAKSPSAMVLDRLWAVLCDIFTNPMRYTREYEQEPGRMVYRADEESRDALLACVPLRPDWLPTIVKTVDPKIVPMHDLANLAAVLEGHPEIWKQCKAILFATVAPEHDYLLAWNVYIHKDKEEIPWLRERIRRTADWGATMAFKAITRIDPDLALQELADNSTFELALNSTRCFEHLLLLQPEATRSCILRQLQQAKDPWNIAHAYSGSEDAMDVPTLDFLLDSLETLLDRIAAGEVPPNTSPLFGPLRLICGVQRLELLHCFARGRGSTFETKLADWLLTEASQEVFALQHDAADALKVLARIGGEGYTRIINQLITSPSVFARYDALCMAHKRPDAETFRLLAQVSVQNGEDNRRIAERAKAILALARCEQWPAFVRGVMHCGFMCPMEIGDARIVPSALDDATMAPVFDALSGPDPTIGAILAVGIGQRKDKIDALCDLLERVQADSEIAQACVQALGLLGDCGERSVCLLEVQLNVPKHYRPAWIALLQNGSDKALDILLKRITRAYDQDIAINLLHRPQVATEVSLLVRQHLASANSEQPFGQRAFEELLVYIYDETLLSDILQGDEVQERLRRSATVPEGWIWYSGAKAAAVHALSVSEKNEAYEVAFAVLRNPHSRDRELYPEILIQLDMERATADLFKQMMVEKGAAVRRAIGLALSKLDLEALLTEKLQSDDVQERTSACQIAAWQVTGNHLDQKLQKCLNDIYIAVVQAAENALHRRQTARILDSLIDAYHHESDPAKKWMLLDTLLDLGDPGISSRYVPQWIYKLCGDMPYLTWVYVREALNNKRKELDDEARSEDFFSRRH